MPPYKSPSSWLKGKKIIVISIIGILIFMLINMMSGTTPSTKNIEVRIKNSTGHDIENFWLGAGPQGGATQESSFGMVEAGEVTEYQQIENITKNYSKANFVINQQRYLVSGITDQLDSGLTYTFIILPDGPEYAITVEID